MLAFNKRWHFAPQQYPERERRLLAFANGQEPEDWPEDMRPSSYNPVGTQQSVAQEKSLRETEAHIAKTTSDIKALRARKIKLGERFKETDKTKQWDETLEKETGLLEKTLTTVNDWKNGKITPLSYVQKINQFLQELGQNTTVSLGDQNAITSEKWNALSSEKRATKIAAIDQEIETTTNGALLSAINLKNADMRALYAEYEQLIAAEESKVEQEKIETERMNKRNEMEELLAKVATSDANIEHLNRRLAGVYPQLDENIAKLKEMYPDKKDIDKINEIRAHIEASKTCFGIMKQLSEAFTQWHDGVEAPVDFAENINKFLEKCERTERITLSQENAIEIGDWVRLTSSERAERMERVTNEINEKIKISTVIDLLASEQEKTATTINNYQEMLDKMNEELKASQPETGEAKPKTFMELWSRINSHVQWVSINDVINSFKKYSEAYSKAWQRRGDNVANRLAEGYGSLTRWLPLGKQVEAELSSAREGSNNEEKEAETKRLEASNAPFTRARQELKTFVGSPNRFYGVVEYMAKNGWLYEYNIEKGQIFGIDMPLPQGWNKENMESYKVKLSVMDSGGQDEQKKSMNEIVGTHESIPPIVDSLRVELNRHNYWAAYAALDIAMKKGKIGEAGTWITATLLEHLRTSEEARKYMPKELFDQMGNIGISHPAWTSTFLKIDRKNLDAWKNSDRPDAFYEAGNLGQVITLIEQEILEKFGAQEPKELTELVAKILAAQTVKDPSKKTSAKISIFSNRYNLYRKTILDNHTSISPGKADDDFFGHISDAHLISEDGLKEILKITSVGDFQETTRALNYVDNLIKLHDQLNEPGLGEALRNMRQENRKKLNAYFKQDAANTDAKIKGWKTRVTRDGTLMIKKFVECGLLDVEIAKRITKDDVRYETSTLHRPGPTAQNQQAPGPTLAV